MEHGRTAPGRMETDLLFRLQDGHARVPGQGGSRGQTGDAAADDENVGTVHWKSAGSEPLIHDLSALRQADRLHDLVVVGQHGPSLLLVPEGGEKIVKVAR